MEIKLTCLHASAVTTEAQRRQQEEEEEEEEKEAASDIHKVSITVTAAVLPMWKQLRYNSDKTKQCKTNKQITHAEEHRREKQRR